MHKLYSFESSDKASNNELLMDKLLEKNKQPDSPVSLTANLLKQREDVTKEVNSQLEEAKKEEEEDNTEPEDNKEDETTKDNKDNKENTEEDNSEKEQPKEEDKDEDSAAEDKDSLQSLVGSGLSDNEEKEKEKPKEDSDKNKPATEHYRPKTNLNSLFDSLHRQHSSYVLSLEAYNLQDKAVPVDKQPIVYVKEAILESIKTLTSVSFKYIDNNTSFIKTISESILKLNERITVLNSLVENSKYHFTHKLVKDKDVIANVSYKDHSDPRETCRVLLRYLEDSNAAISMVMNNEFEEMKSAFLSREFTAEDNDIVYNKPLPGFNIIKVAFEPYNNYLKTKVENFQYYKLRFIRPEDLYGLPAISITKDKDLEYIVKTLSSLLVSVTVTVDTLKGVNQNFNTFTDELKVIAYNVDNDQYSNLSEIGIDQKLKDFIKFKIAMEASYININMTMDYIVSILSVLDVCLELAE